MIYNCSQYFHPTWPNFPTEMNPWHSTLRPLIHTSLALVDIGLDDLDTMWAVRLSENDGDHGKIWEKCGNSPWDGMGFPPIFGQTHVVLKLKHGSNLIPSGFNWFHQLHSCLGNPRMKCFACLITPQGNYPTIWYPMVSPVIPGEFPGPVACSG